jgi:hypothetical protein
MAPLRVTSDSPLEFEVADEEDDLETTKRRKEKYDARRAPERAATPTMTRRQDDVDDDGSASPSRRASPKSSPVTNPFWWLSAAALTAPIWPSPPATLGARAPAVTADSPSYPIRTAAGPVVADFGPGARTDQTASSRAPVSRRPEPVLLLQRVNVYEPGGGRRQRGDRRSSTATTLTIAATTGRDARRRASTAWASG